MFGGPLGSRGAPRGFCRLGLLAPVGRALLGLHLPGLFGALWFLLQLQGGEGRLMVSERWQLTSRVHEEAYTNCKKFRQTILAHDALL